MENFSRLKADFVLKKSSLDEYRKIIDFFEYELSKLNTDIFIVKKILEFPFVIFCSPKDTIFFSRVVWNFYENSVLTVIKLTTDQRGKLDTLFQFKNWVYQQVKKRYELDFKNWMKKSKFDSNTKMILKKAEKVRNQIIAHFDKHPLLGMGKLKYLDIKELEQLKNSLNSVLETLSFDVEPTKMLHPSYNDPKGVGYRSDIEALLDSIAKNSEILNMPERSPELWKCQKESLDKEGEKIFNKYRKKFNLSEVYE